jgi:hypothetical protein
MPGDGAVREAEPVRDYSMHAIAPPNGLMEPVAVETMPDDRRVFARTQKAGSQHRRGRSIFHALDGQTTAWFATLDKVSTLQTGAQFQVGGLRIGVA